MLATKIFKNRSNRYKYNFKNVVFTQRYFYH